MRSVLKPSPPVKFKGLVSESASSWIEEMKRWLNYDPRMSEAMKVSTAVTYLEGAASIWYTAVVDARYGMGVQTVKELEELLLVHFQAKLTEQSERRQLGELRFQNYGSIKEYTHAFQRLLLDIPHGNRTDSDVLFQYSHHLPDTYQRAIITGKATTLQEAHALAQPSARRKFRKQYPVVLPVELLRIMIMVPILTAVIDGGIGKVPR